MGLTVVALCALHCGGTNEAPAAAAMNRATPDAAATSPVDDRAASYGCKDDCAGAMQTEGGTTSPFSRDAAAQTLGDIASKLASCRRPDGPTGVGKVRVVFEPTGIVSAVELVDGPFQGTATGGCILQRFRSARVPPFAGSAVPANKTILVPEN